jgi:hypothetical protein
MSMEVVVEVVDIVDGAGDMERTGGSGRIETTRGAGGGGDEGAGMGGGASKSDEKLVRDVGILTGETDRAAGCGSGSDAVSELVVSSDHEPMVPPSSSVSGVGGAASNENLVRRN